MILKKHKKVGQLRHDSNRGHKKGRQLDAKLKKRYKKRLNTLSMTIIGKRSWTVSERL